MESNTNAQDYKKKLDNYEISQNEIPKEIKQEIANLYVNEIEKTRKQCNNLFIPACDLQAEQYISFSTCSSIVFPDLWFVLFRKIVLRLYVRNMTGTHDVLRFSHKCLENQC